MNNQGRIENSAKNSVFGVASQVANIFLGLLVRTVFIKTLSSEYLGVNGLFSNILTMLSLAEMGIGNAIVFNMYKPIANRDYETIAKLMNLYRKAYMIVGIIVAIVGLAITPFLDFIIKDQPDIDHITLIYFMFLANTVLSYFFAYKQSIFSADQNQRVLHIFRLTFHIIRSAFQIVVLLVWKNFYLYLIVQIVCTVLENSLIALYADRKYPFLKTYRKSVLDKEAKKPIFENIKSLFIYKIGSTVLDGTDNIIISAMDGVASVGLLSNYTLVTGSLQGVLTQVTGSITGSVGNFIAKEKEERHEQMLENINFFYFVIYGIVFVGLASALNPFVKIWAGENYLLDYTSVFIHCLNIYIYGMMGAVWTFRTTMGLFRYGKWRPLISAVINVIVSIWWAKYLGLLGVLLGTTFSRVVTNLWYDPYIVYHHGLKKKPFVFYAKWVMYLLVCLVDIAVIQIALKFIKLPGLVAFLVSGVAAVLLFAGSVVLIFRKRPEYQYLLSVLKNFMNRIRKKK